jgi:hypothetical protein
MHSCIGTELHVRIRINCEERMHIQHHISLAVCYQLLGHQEAPRWRYPAQDSVQKSLHYKYESINHYSGE